MTLLELSTPNSVLGSGHGTHTFAPSSVQKHDFRTGGSMKRNVQYWSEIPNWFRTIQNWVETIQTIPKTFSNLVLYS